MDRKHRIYLNDPPPPGSAKLFRGAFWGCLIEIGALILILILIALAICVQELISQGLIP